MMGNHVFACICMYMYHVLVWHLLGHWFTTPAVPLDNWDSLWKSPEVISSCSRNAPQQALPVSSWKRSHEFTHVHISQHAEWPKIHDFSTQPKDHQGWPHTQERITYHRENMRARSHVLEMFTCIGCIVHSALEISSEGPSACGTCTCTRGSVYSRQVESKDTRQAGGRFCTGRLPD